MTHVVSGARSTNSFTPANVAGFLRYSSSDKGQVIWQKGDIVCRLSSVMSYHVMAAILGLIEPEIVPKPNMEWIRSPVADIWPFEHSKMASAAIIHLIQPEIAPFDSPIPKTLPYNKT